MTRKCAAIINASATEHLLIATLNSLLAQRFEGIVETLVVGDDDSAGRGDVTSLLAAMPWASFVRAAPAGKPELDLYLEKNPDVEYLFFLDAGDELLAGTIDRLSEAFETQKTGMVLSAARWSNGSETWAYPQVDDIFHMRAAVTALRGVWESEHPDTSFTAYRSKDWLARDKDRVLQCAVIHDYLVRKYHAGAPPKNACYLVHADRLPPQENSVASPFPQPGPGKQSPTQGAWIFGERLGQAAGDNAWALFEHCRRHRQDIECYYALAPGAQIAIPPEHQPFVVRIGSTKWRHAIQQASHVFFTDTAADVFQDHSHVLAHPDLCYVYLTHGYLAHSPGVYQRGHAYFDRVVCTSLEDTEVASREWGLPCSRFIRTGLPRWDKLRTGHSAQREILFCPSWRKSLGATGRDLAAQPSREEIEAFEQSEYFRAVADLLSDSRLEQYLEANDATLTFSLHFRLVRYLSCFEHFASDRIRIISAKLDDRPLQQLLQDACALITDYSSIFWDMAYMEKPVVAYQFDKPAMLAERGREQFALRDPELPCVVCNCPDELFSALEAIAENQFHLDARQLSIVDRFIPERDGQACARLIDTLRPSANANDPDVRARQGAEVPGLFVSDAPTEEVGPAPTASIIRGGIGGGPGGHVSLRPEAWREQLKLPDLKRIVVEPHLAAGSVWADTFFDPDATLRLLDDFSETAGQLGLTSELWVSPLLPYAHRLDELAGQFDRVRKPGLLLNKPGHCDVSVIIPVHNGATVIEKSIDSVLEQDFQGSIEIVVVDDGSTDETPDIVHRYSQQHPEIVLLKQPNARQGMARNRGILAASGEFVMFLDADDRLAREAVATLYLACEFEKTDVAVGLVVSCGPGGENQRVNQAYAHYRWAPPVIDLERWPHLAFDPSCIGKLFRKSFLVENRLFFPQSYHEDQAFCAYLYATGAAIAVTKSVVCFYVATSSKNSGTQTFSSEKLEQILLVGNLVSQLLRTSGVCERRFEKTAGYLLMRYDRFLWKRAQSEAGQMPESEEDRVIDRLGRFLQQIDESVIPGSARYHPEFFVALKRGREELARKLLRGNFCADLADEALSQSADLSPVRAEESVADPPAYDYYRAVPVSQLLRDQRQSDTALVNDMSYGYRLGAPFVDAVKSPIRVFLIPHKLLHLAFDMATGRGRTKQEQRHEDLLKYSYAVAMNHSNLIKEMAGYRLGIALMEAATGSPGVLRKLPERIRNIYRETARSD